VTVTFTATDCAGNSSSTTATFTVVDTTPPELTVPPDVDLGCNPQDTGPDATGWATAKDNCDPNPKVTYTDSFSTVGCRITIERTWQAADACGNTSTGVQRITYTQDPTPPTIHCPNHVYRTSTEPPGTLVWVNYPITASDNCDPSPRLSYNPSGGWFEVGTTTPASTSCTAQDSCGNVTSRECVFLVTVEFVCPPLVARDDTADCPGYVGIPVLNNDSGYGLRIVDVTPPPGHVPSNSVDWV
ncbi:MAG: HYR domain-containing protein, partial [Chloroflexi bacterium]|nr:HYR domain-containing protein [Chloroflexota bacterium]